MPAESPGVTAADMQGDCVTGAQSTSCGGDVSSSRDGFEGSCPIAIVAAAQAKMARCLMVFTLFPLLSAFEAESGATDQKVISRMQFL